MLLWQKVDWYKTFTFVLGIWAFVVYFKKFMLIFHFSKIKANANNSWESNQNTHVCFHYPERFLTNELPCLCHIKFRWKTGHKIEQVILVALQGEWQMNQAFLCDKVKRPQMSCHYTSAREMYPVWCEHWAVVKCNEYPIIITCKMRSQLCVIVIIRLLPFSPCNTHPNTKNGFNIRSH